MRRTVLVCGSVLTLLATTECTALLDTDSLKSGSKDVGLDFPRRLEAKADAPRDQPHGEKMIGDAPQPIADKPPPTVDVAPTDTMPAAESKPPADTNPPVIDKSPAGEKPPG